MVSSPLARAGAAVVVIAIALAALVSPALALVALVGIALVWVATNRAGTGQRLAYDVASAGRRAESGSCVGRHTAPVSRTNARSRRTVSRAVASSGATPSMRPSMRRSR